MNEKNLKDIAAVLAALAALIGAVVALYDKFVELWHKILWPLIKILTFMATLAVPIGILMWFFTDLAAENSSRLDEHIVVWSLVVQATTAVFVYALFWGMLVCPKLRFLLRWSAQQPTDTDKKEEGERESDTRKSEVRDTNSGNGESAESQGKQGGVT
jgi:hypothetical protein